MGREQVQLERKEKKNNIRKKHYNSLFIAIAECNDI